MSNRMLTSTKLNVTLIIFTLLLILLSVTSKAADDKLDDKPTTPDVIAGGTLQRISLANSSYEDGTDAPDNWTPLTGYVGDHYLWDTEVAKTGTKSIAIRGTRYFYGRWESEAIDVQKAGFSWYTLTGDVKTLRNTGEVYLAIAWLDTHGALLTTADSYQLPPGDTEWQSVSLNALPPAGAASVSVWCISNHNHGTSWFDDPKLTVT